MAKNITVIPATRNQHTGIPTMTKYKRRVAGYARVSTDSEEQQTSYAAQVDYYTNFIQARPDWTLVRVYTDEGLAFESDFNSNEPQELQLAVQKRRFYRADVYDKTHECVVGISNPIWLDADEE